MRLVGRSSYPCARLAAVFLPLDHIGKQYPSVMYAVGREKVREYASAVGETNRLHHDVGHARMAGYADVLAPAMFVVVYAGPVFMQALFDPDLEIDFAHLVHGAQEFRWEQPVVAGDEIETTLTVEDISERAGLRFDRFRTTSVNQRGERTCVGIWSTIIRGED